MAWDLIRQEIGTHRAGEDMTSARGRAVTFNTFERWQIAGFVGPLSGIVTGILTNTPKSGDVASVQVYGVAEGLLGGVVTAGRRLGIDGTGALIEDPTGVVGIALDNGIAGSIIPVYLNIMAPGSGGADGVVTAGSVVGTDIVLNRSIGGDVSIDVSSLGGGGVFGSQLNTSEVSTQLITTVQPSAPNNILAGTFPVVHNSLVVPALPSGDYLFKWNYSWNKDDTPSDFLARLNGGTTGLFGFHRAAAYDSLGAVNPDAPPGSGTDQRYWNHGETILTGYTGSETIDLEFASGVAGTQATIINSLLTLWRLT